MKESDRRGRWELALILGLGLVFCPGEVKSQLQGGDVATDAPTALWLTAGLGATNGMAGIVAGSLQRGRAVVSLRMADTWEGKVVDVGLLAGRVFSTGSVYLSASGGLAPVFGRRISTTVGVPFEVQAFLRRSFVGIGAYGFGNLNPRESFAGVAVSLQLGRF